MTLKLLLEEYQSYEQDIVGERLKQETKWGEQNWTDEWWKLIMEEETGETARAILEEKFKSAYPDNYPDIVSGRTREELVHVVAVGIAWLAAIDRRVSDAGNKEVENENA